MKLNTEYRKGIIFIRITGSLDKKTFKILEEKINYIVCDCLITNIVLNLDEISKIDMKGISSLYHTYEVIKKYRGIIYLYIKNSSIKKELVKSRIFNYIKKIDSELDAFSLIKI